MAVITLNQDYPPSDNIEFKGGHFMRRYLGAVLIGIPLLVFFIATRGVGQKGGEKDDPLVANERRAAFAWMTGLGYPDTKDLKFVLVATGDWVQYGNKDPENRFQYGFLMEEKGASFKILSLNLEAQTFEKTPANMPAYKKVDFEVLELGKEALTLLKNLQDEAKKEMKPGLRMGNIFGPSLWERTEVFLLAWACSQRGLDDAAAKLYNHARSPKYNRYGEDQEKPVKTLQEKVADDLAYIEMWRAVLAFGNPQVPRRELNERFERIVKNFPKSQYHARARETAVLLKQMIQEDEEHAARRKKGKPFDQLTKKEQIAELIFQLRDQPGHQFMQPGWCDIFMTFAGGKDTPAHRLVDIGYDAVPQLVEVLDDKRFSRAVGFHRNFYFSHEVLRVGECAQTILERIAGVSFDKPRFAKDSNDLKGKDLVRAEVKVWYAEIQKKGEKAFLMEATERGDDFSSEMAERLVKKFRSAALPVLMKGAKATKVGHVRATLVGLIASYKGEPSLQFLLAEAKDGPLGQPRLTAAEELHKLGRPEGLAAMMAWWRDGVVDARKRGKERDEDPAGWASYIADFLANCGEVEAINALAKDLRNRPIALRLEVISVLGGSGTFRSDKTPAKEPAKVAAAVEALLVAALDDTEEYVGMSGSWNGKEYADPRICDMAGHVLNQLDAKKYSFDLAAQLGPRNRQLVIMKNVWRSANQLPLLPVPELRKIAPVPADKLDPLLDRYRTSAGDKRLAVRDEIEKLGLSALPGVLERRDKTTDKSEQAAWSDLAKRLSCIVAEVEFADRSVKPDARVAKLAAKITGKPFDAKTFIQTVGSILKSPPEGVQGVRVVALRQGDGTGFSVMFHLLGSANPRNAQGPPTQWGFSERVRLGKDVIRSQFGAMSAPAPWIEGNYPDLEKVLAVLGAIDPGRVPSLPARIYAAISNEFVSAASLVRPLA
jgi:hypothetical protein